MSASSATSPFVTGQIFTAGEAQSRFASEILPPYFQTRRWFGGKARAPRDFAIEETIRLGRAHLLVVRVSYPDDASESYLLPVQFVDAEPPAGAVIARAANGWLIDATHEPQFRADLLRMMSHAEVIPLEHGELRGIPGPALDASINTLHSRVLAVEQSNSAIVYGDRIFLKLYRKLEEGINPDAEIARFLSERCRFAHVPPFGGSLELHDHGRVRVLGLALGLVHNQGDAWEFTLKELQSFFARAALSDDLARAPVGDYPESAFLLGVRTGELHCALASDETDPLFAPEPFTGGDQRELAGAIRKATIRTLSLLEAHEPRANDERRLVEALLASQPLIEQRTHALELREIGVTKTRTHGDYHLGQVLYTGSDFMIIDFEGEPLRPLIWRKRKRSPLRDVAGMLRSFDYAAYSALGETPSAHRDLAVAADEWRDTVSKRFVEGWRKAAGRSAFVPSNDDDFQTLLDGFLLEKVIYEIDYELNNRPGWLPIPARGLLRILTNA